MKFYILIHILSRNKNIIISILSYLCTVYMYFKAEGINPPYYLEGICVCLYNAYSSLLGNTMINFGYISDQTSDELTNTNANS